MKKFLLIPVVLISILSCQSLSDSSITEIKNEIAEITDNTLKYFNDRDTANVYAYYSDDFTALSGGKLRIVPEEWELFKTEGKKAVATRAPVTYEITNSIINVLSPTVVNHHFIYKRKVSPADDMFFESPVACTWTFVLEGNSWKIHNAHISYPMENYRAGEGDTVFLALLDVLPDGKDVYDRISEYMFDKVAEVDQQAELIMSKTRVFYPTEPNEDGTFTYIVMFDPIYTGKYSFSPGYLIPKIYGEEEGKEILEEFGATIAGSQKSYTVIQSKY
jgi:hypothetical protein